MYIYNRSDLRFKIAFSMTVMTSEMNKPHNYQDFYGFLVLSARIYSFHMNNSARIRAKQQTQQIEIKMSMFLFQAQETTLESLYSCHNNFLLHEMCFHFFRISNVHVLSEIQMTTEKKITISNQQIEKIESSGC